MPSPFPFSSRLADSRQALLCIACLIAGLAGNALHFRLFLNIDFLFGSIFAMLILQLSGLRHGVIAAAVISSYTFPLWNHPYAIVIMTAETAVAGWAHRRFRIGLVFADTLYWLCLGMPLVALFYGVVMHAEISTPMVMLKQAMNGITNTLSARLLFMGYTHLSRTNHLPLREMLTNLLASFVLVPALFMLIVNGRQDYADAEREVQEYLTLHGRQLSGIINQWLENRRFSVVNLARTTSDIPTPQIQVLLEELLKIENNIERFCVLDGNAEAIAMAPPVDEQGRKLIGNNFAALPYLPQLQQTLTPLLTGVVEGKVGAPKPVVLILAPLLKKGQYAGYIGGRITLSQLSSILDKGCDGRLLYTLLDQEYHVVVSNHPDRTTMQPFVREPGMVRQTGPSLSQWTPEIPQNTPISERWKKSLYINESNIQGTEGWKLILEEPVERLQRALYSRYCHKLSALFIVLLVVLGCVEITSRRLLVTLEKLCALTHDLVDKLEKNETALQWPRSSLPEINHLIDAFKNMAEQLSAQFAAARRVNLNLEQQVEERTRSLKATTDLFQTLTDCAPVGIFQADGRGSVTFVNTHWCEMTGLSEQQASGIGWFSALHPDDRDMIIAHWTDSITSKKDFFTLEFRFLTSSGATHWVYTLAKRLREQEEHHCRYIGCVVDLTGRRLAEAALTEHVANFTNLVETVGDLIVVATTEGQILFCNQACTRKLGYSTEELAAMHILELHPQEHRREAEDIFAAMLRGEQISCPLPVQSKDGQLVPVETRIWLGTWNGVACVFGFLKDLSEEQEARQLFERLFQNNPASMAVTSPTTRCFIGINKAYEQILGYDKAEIIGKTAQELGLFVSPERYVQTYQQLLTEGRINEVEIQVRCKDGSILDGLFSGEVISSHGQQYFLTVMVDITARKQAEAALLESTERLSAATRAAHLGIYSYDFDSGHAYYSPEFLDLFGAGAVKLDEDLVAKALHPADKPGFLKRMRVANTPGGSGILEHEYRIVRPDGATRWLRVVGRTIFSGDAPKDRPLRAIGIVQDLTNRKRIEEELIRSRERAVAADAAKSTLLATVAHEFRTPLSLLESSLDILDRYGDRLSNEQHREQEQYLRNASRQLNLLVDTVLSYEQMHARQLPSRAERVDIGQICRAIADETRASWSQRHDFQVEVAPALGTLIIDPTLLRRVVENLLTNAFHYTPAGGRIVFSVFRDNSSLRLEVTDQGLGIAEDEQAKIFDPFFRGRNVGPRRGMGLGLNIVRDTLQQMGGDIALTSQLGQGTTFQVTLPWREEENSAFPSDSAL